MPLRLMPKWFVRLWTSGRPRPPGTLLVGNVKPVPSSRTSMRTRVPFAPTATLMGSPDGVDVVVGRGDDGDAAAGVVVVDPGGGETGEVVVEGAGDDPAVRLVGVERGGVAASQLQRRGGFPGVGEAVEAFELARRGRWRTARRTGRRGRRPAAGAGHRPGRAATGCRSARVDELVEGGGGQHPGLVDDQRRARPAAGTRAAVAGRCVATRGAAWRPCRRGCRCRARRSGPPWRSAPPRTRHDRGRARSSAAAVSMRVLPAPAGPTTSTSRSSPATAAAASACNGSRPSRSTVVDGAGGSAWAAIAHVRIASSWARTGSDVNRGAVGSIHTDRPSEPRRVRVAGRVEVDAAGRRRGRWPAPAWPPSRCPDCCDTGRCTSQIACSTSARVHDDRCCDTASTTSATMQRLRPGRRRRRPRRCWRRAGRRSSRRRRLRSATVSSDRRRRGRTCADRVSADASRVSAARSHRDGSRPSRWRKSSSLSASAASMSAVRFENTARSSSGTPAISACPLTIGRQSTPKRWVSSARSTDW